MQSSGKESCSNKVKIKKLISIGKHDKLEEMP